MSIVQDIDLIYRPFAIPNGADPGLPAGYWRATGEVVGDASAGIAQVAVTISLPGTGNVNNNYFSLEQWDIHNDDAATNDRGQLLLTDWNDVPALGAVSYDYTIFLRDHGLTTVDGNALEMSHAETHPKLFLGKASSISGAQCRILIDFKNNLNITYFAHLEGYYWTPGAINAPGGFRRPIDYLYPA